MNLGDMEITPNSDDLFDMIVFRTSLLLIIKSVFSSSSPQQIEPVDLHTPTDGLSFYCGS